MAAHSPGFRVYVASPMLICKVLIGAGLPVLFGYKSTQTRPGYRRAIEATVAAPSKSTAVLTTPSGPIE